jgi:hypothetical protein
MKIAFSVIVVFHGIIHLLGVIKGFKLAESDRFSGDISRTEGFFWLIALLLFLLSVILLFANADFWWIIGLPAVIVSQILIIMQWQDAKFGTVANIIILIVLFFAFSEWNFNNMVRSEVKEFISAGFSEEKIITEDDISGLPPLIKKWLHRSNIVGQSFYQIVNLKQKGEMRTSPDGKWMNFNAEQWSNSSKPEFIWKTDVSMFPGIFMVGRDKYLNGEGSMLIKLLSLITVVDSKGPEINQGACLRYLGELVWFPYAVLNKIYLWEEIDPVTAKITLKQGDISCSAIYKFTEEGDFLSFEAKRYYDRKEGATLEDWLVIADGNGYREFESVRIPAKLSVVWKLKEGDFNWLNLEITDVRFK